MSRRSFILIACLAMLIAVFPVIPRSSAQTGSGPSAAEQQQAAERMMAQLAEIDGQVDIDKLVADPALGPPPWTAFVPDRDPSTIEAWNAIAARIGDAKADDGPSLDAAQRLGVVGVQDIEAPDESGLNDSIQTGQFIASFGSGPGQDDTAQLLGTLGVAAPPPPPPPPPVAGCQSIEDDGNINAANPALTPEINGLVCEGFIGDGEFGASSGDIDMFQMGEALAGSPMIVDAFGPADLAVTVAVYDQNGTFIAQANDFGPEFLELVAPADGVYFAAVAGVAGLPVDPFDSASGPAATTTGGYAVFVGVAPVPPPPAPPCVSFEDDGSISLATIVEPPSPAFTTCLGMIGDGPFGQTSGDVDVFNVSVVDEVQVLIADLVPRPEVQAARLAVYDQAGTLIAFVDDDGVVDENNTFLSVEVPGPANYFVMVSAPGHSPTDANDSSSGLGILDTLLYELVIATFSEGPQPPQPVPTPTPTPTPAPPVPFNCVSTEGDGSIPSANIVPLEFEADLITDCIGFIGDGPDAFTGDVDAFTIDVPFPEAELFADIVGSNLPIEFTLYDELGNVLPFGELIAAADVAPGAFQSTIVAGGRYHVIVSEVGGALSDPFDATSGPGPNQSVGEYQVTFGIFPFIDLPELPEPEPRLVPAPPAAAQFIAEQLGQRLDAVDAGSASLTNQAQALRAEILPAPCVSVEDDGAIGLANPTGSTVSAGVVCDAVIGDGPFGDSTGDFDVYAIEGSAGDVLAADIDARIFGSTLDSFLWLFDGNGQLLAANDDADGLDSLIVAELPADGIWYVVVGAYATTLNDPFDSASGSGANSVGPYTLTIGAFEEPPPPDIDVYLFDLVPGDVVRAGLRLSGTAAIIDPLGVVRQETGTTGAFIYPLASPLRHLGSVGVDHVADVAGTYALVITNGSGPYDGELFVTRPGRTSSPGDDTQIVFLDFDGASTDPTLFDPFVPVAGIEVPLSGLATFLPRWGLSAADEDAVIDGIVATFAENVSEDLRLIGGNGDRDASGVAGEFDIEIRNSRDDADPWGEPNVSRIIIGGSIAELGIPTVGIAQAIDPGNLVAEETGVVLLDLLSDPPGLNSPTLNEFGVAAPATTVDLVSIGVGVIAAHELGHLIGNWHTDVTNLNPAVMDEGGDLAAVLGVGLDRVLGTGDDTDTDFEEDTYSIFEFFSGTEDTRIRSGFAMATGQTVPVVVPEIPEVPGPGVYLLQNVATDRYLDADPGSQADTSSSPSEDDQWELIETDGGVYLRNVLYERVLDSDPGDRVDMSSSPSSDDVWAIEPVADDRFLVRAVQRGGNLTVDNNDVDRSSSIGADAQWHFILIGDPPEPPPGPGDLLGARIALRSAATSRWLDADWGNNAWDVEQSQQQSDDDIWLVSDAGDGAVHLINNATNRYLDADGSGSGYNVDTSRNPAADDRWEIVSVDGGVALRNLDRDRWLSADGSPGFGVGTDFAQSQSTVWQVVVIADIG